MTLRDHVTWFNAVLLAVLVGAVVWGFATIPAGTLLPVHWGVSGSADGFLPREPALLLLPGIALAAELLLIGAQYFADRGRAGASRHAIAVAVSALLAMFATIEVAIVLIGNGVAVDVVRLAVLAVGAMMIVLGNVMPKTQPNPVAGIRLPWTMRDPANWQATNRLGGLLLMASGALMVVAALVTGHPVVLLAITIGGLVVSMAATVGYSWNRARAR